MLRASPQSVLLLTETLLLTVNPIVPRRTHRVPALRPPEPRLTQAAAVDVEAPCTVGTVTHTFAVLAIGSCSALLLTPERSAGRLSSRRQGVSDV